MSPSIGHRQSHPAFLLVALLSIVNFGLGSTTCRCMPDDSCWPGPDQWGELYSAVGGRLIQTQPMGSPCHDPNFNAAECTYLQQQWDYPALAAEYPSAIDAPYFQNGTCDPFHPPSLPCTIGNLVSYSVNATSAADVAAAIDFASENNIRLVIKNTGHDYLGKSTGKGALGIWTHNLKTIQPILNYTSSSYSGPAIKLGAGVQGFEAYEAANALGYRVIGGTCPTVGIAGGYTSGGGHSVLSSLYGLGADNVLEWEVVLANGTHTTASSTSNPDLYWALSGGGAGTFAVVLSMTTKMHEDGPVGGANLVWNLTSTNGTDWDAVTVLQAGMANFVDNGNAAIYEIDDQLVDAIITCPSLTQDEVASELSFITDFLTSSNITYQLSTSYDPTYLDHYIRYYGPLPNGSYQSAQLTGSRLIPRSVILNASSNAVLTQTYQEIVASGEWTLGVVAVNLSYNVSGKQPGENAVLPAWRTVLTHTIVYSPWNWSLPVSTMLDREYQLTNSIEPQLEALTPDSGTYMNEANFEQIDFQEAFYGTNYAQLLSIKNAYDPNNLFYAKTAVGSEAWTEQSNGQLCRS